MLKINRLITRAAVALTLFSATQSQAANLCDQVWNGSVERIRVQQQASGETVFRVYLTPGNTAQYVGYTTSGFMVDVLLKAQENGTDLQECTDDKCQIVWFDFR